MSLVNSSTDSIKIVSYKFKTSLRVGACTKMRSFFTSPMSFVIVDQLSSEFLHCIVLQQQQKEHGWAECAIVWGINKMVNLWSGRMSQTISHCRCVRRLHLWVSPFVKDPAKYKTSTHGMVWARTCLLGCCYCVFNVLGFKGGKNAEDYFKSGICYPQFKVVQSTLPPHSATCVLISSRMNCTTVGGGFHC